MRVTQMKPRVPWISKNSSAPYSWLRMYMSGAYDTSIMPSRSSHAYSHNATVGASKNSGPRRTTACTLRMSSSTSHERHRVLVHHVVEEVAARALVVEAPHVARGVELGLEARVGPADDRLDAHDRGLADRAGTDRARAPSRAAGSGSTARSRGTRDPRRARLRPCAGPSATLFAIGFWHDTCLPAASAART